MADRDAPRAATLAAALRTARERLRTTSDTPDLDARWLAEHALGVGATYLITHADDPLPDDVRTRYDRCVARRAAGEPVAHIVGRVGFWSLDLSVTADVLVPRPDTETLVAAALARLDARAPLEVADLGTGSGAIALALARERPAWRLTATDASDPALAVARDNARALNITNVAFAAGRWFDAIAGRRFDAIVSNPPYVARNDPHLAALTHEPAAALVAAEDGLADLAAIARGAPAHLNPNGWLLLEHGADQGAPVRDLLADAGFASAETWRDLGGRERVTGARLGAGLHPRQNATGARVPPR